MKYSAWLLVLGLGLALGCGGGGDDAPPTGFEDPDTPMIAYSEIDGVWTEQGPADWSCLNTASSDQATTVEVTLTGEVDDFQTGNDVPEGNVSLFHNDDHLHPFAETVTDEDGVYTVTVPVGTTRFGFKMWGEGTMDTFLLNQYIEPDVAEQRLGIDSVSELTANAMPAFIGITRTEGLAIVGGAMRDCNDNEVYGAIATVSSVQGSPEHLQGSDKAGSFYFSAGSTSLPVRNGQQRYTNFDGLFMVIELPPADTSQWLQVWGFLTQEDVDGGDLTLIAEIPTPLLADNFVTFSLEPLRN